MKKEHILTIMISITSFILVTFITMQLKTVRVNEENNLQLTREKDLREEIVQLRETNKSLTSKLDKSEKSLNDYRTSQGNNDKLFASLKNDLEDASMLAGLTQVQGPGITITLANQTSNDNNNYAIQYSDLLSIINELKDAGTEAISLNGQRIIATSEIRNAGEFIIVNNTRISSPFTIKAIGNKDYLESALKMTGGPIENLKLEFNINITIKSYKDLVVEKYNKIFEYKYGKLVK